MGITTDKIEVTEISKGKDNGGYSPDVVDVEAFFERVLEGYADGSGPGNLPADVNLARSLIPAGTAARRDFSFLAPEIPEYNHENCVGCMSCVVECPDTAILGKVIEVDELEARLAAVDDAEQRQYLSNQFAVTTKFYTSKEKRGQDPGKFGIFIDPTKCKGCAECVEVCHDLGYNALKMIPKQDETVPKYQAAIAFYRSLPPTPDEFVSDRLPVDYMLSEKAMLFTGGAGSCAGCGEATALRMMLAATGYQYGQENIGLVAATGCNTVYGSTYPYNPYIVPWTNSLFENAPAVAMGVRARWDQIGWKNKRIWTIGGDGAMFDIGFQSLSRMLASGMDIKVLVLDTQVYSNTGGQTSTASFMGQDAKMSAIGSALGGKQEQRKEIGRILMMHPNTYVAQTVASIPNHFFKAVMDANSFPGPAVVVVYTTCQPEHGVADDMSRYQSKLAVESRAFPIFVYDPRNGETIRERLDLKGNPAMKEDWYTIPKTGEMIDFITFARSEGRFARNFKKDGAPDQILLDAQADRLANWHFLQELAGLR
ncbi:MAG: 4Fe-4S dicluster domain-containing protein [Chloroflexi bacterium]|nr:4Fe-4S dicluster domain-containing protein [Chloroflexota bacterium]